VSAFYAGDVDVPSLPDPAFLSEILCVVCRNVVTSFFIVLSSQGMYHSLVASPHISVYELVKVLPTISYSAFWTRIHIWATFMVKQLSYGTGWASSTLNRTFQSIQKVFITLSSSGSNSLDWGWEDMKLLGWEHPHNRVDPPCFGKSKGRQMMRRLTVEFNVG